MHHRWVPTKMNIPKEKKKRGEQYKNERSEKRKRKRRKYEPKWEQFTGISSHLMFVSLHSGLYHTALHINQSLLSPCFIQQINPLHTSGLLERDRLSVSGRFIPNAVQGRVESLLLWRSTSLLTPCLRKPWKLTFSHRNQIIYSYVYSIHVIAEYNLLGSKIICRQIYVSNSNSSEIEISTLLDRLSLRFRRIWVGCIYLSTDYLGTRQIIFGNDMNAINI